MKSGWCCLWSFPAPCCFLSASRFATFCFRQVFKFIQGFAPKAVTATPDIEAYLDFVLSMFLAFGLAFEVPIVVIVLARLNMVSIESSKPFAATSLWSLSSLRRLLRPPDVVSQLALAIPMCILYQIGILGCKAFIRYTQPPPDDAPQQQT